MRKVLSILIIVICYSCSNDLTVSDETDNDKESRSVLQDKLENWPNAYFNDPNLRYVLKEMFPEPTLEDIENVKVLDLKFRNIKDLTGLGIFKNLEELNLQGNAIKDLRTLMINADIKQPGIYNEKTKFTFEKLKKLDVTVNNMNIWTEPYSENDDSHYYTPNNINWNGVIVNYLYKDQFFNESGNKLPDCEVEYELYNNKTPDEANDNMEYKKSGVFSYSLNKEIIDVSESEQVVQFEACIASWCGDLTSLSIIVGSNNPFSPGSTIGGTTYFHERFSNSSLISDYDSTLPTIVEVKHDNITVPYYWGGKRAGRFVFEFTIPKDRPAGIDVVEIFKKLDDNDHESGSPEDVVCTFEIINNNTPDTDFIYSRENGYITIHGYRGMLDVIEVPSYIEDQPVKILNRMNVKSDIYKPKIILPDTLKEINYAAFIWKSFDSIEIPASVKTIHGSAFNSCKVENLIFKRVDDISEYRSHAITNLKPGSKISVPASKLNEYKKKFPDYADIIYGY